MDRTRRVARSAAIAGVTIFLVGGAAMGANLLRHDSGAASGPLTVDEPTETPEATETAEPAETPEATETPEASTPSTAGETTEGTEA